MTCAVMPRASSCSPRNTVPEALAAQQLGLVLVVRAQHDGDLPDSAVRAMSTIWRTFTVSGNRDDQHRGARDVRLDQHLRRLRRHR